MNKNEIPYLILISLCMLPWAYLQSNIIVPGDAAFLFSGMLMMLEGKSMSEYFYDNNPPMSFLIYTPAAILHLLGASKYLAIQTYTMLFSLFSVFISYYLLGKWKKLDIEEKFIFLSCYICAITLMPYVEYGQKDHFIAISLVPFLLSQISITKKHDIPSYIYWIIFIIYVPFILIKPHYGLLPTCVIVHRVYTEKNLSSILKPDFMSLAAGCILYLTFIFTITPDYVSEILPNAINLYIASDAPTDTIYKHSFAFSVFIASTIIIAKLSNHKTEAKNLVIIFAIFALLSLIPFIVQNRGYSLHLLPVFCFSLIAAGNMAYIYLKNKFQKVKYCGLIFIILFYSNFAFNRQIYKINHFKESSFFQLIKDEAETEPYFIETLSTNIIATTSFYNDNKLASRFPALWFLPAITELPPEEILKPWSDFSNMMIEDIEKFSPKVLMFKGKTEEDDYTLFMALIDSSKKFKEIFEKNYIYKKQYKLTKNEYRDLILELEQEPNEVIYDVYIRKN